MFGRGPQLVERLTRNPGAHRPVGGVKVPGERTGRILTGLTDAYKLEVSPSRFLILDTTTCFEAKNLKLDFKGRSRLAVLSSHYNFFL